MYNKSIYNFVIVCDTTVFWIAITVVITAFLDLDVVDDIGLFYMVLGIPFKALVYKMAINRRNWKYLELKVKEFKKDTDVEMYINVLMDLIENRERSEDRIKLEGLLKYQAKFGGKNELNNLFPPDE